MASTFVHLHLHSEYSLLDGGNRVGPLIDRIKQLGMDAVALTDHGNLFGAAEFYTRAKEAGVKPILGIEAYVAPDVGGAPGDRRVKEAHGVADGGFHLVLLAENLTGWQHLLKLSSDAYINGFYYKPRMDKQTLSHWADGLIAINGHLGSSIAWHLMQFVRTGNRSHYDNARKEAQWHAETFGVNEAGEPRFYLELQRHGVEEQERINPHIIELARELNLPLVADNDAHFLTAEDHDAHDTLICVSMGKLKSDEDRLRYPQQLYVKSPEQMEAAFEDVPEAIENTRKIADRCNVELDFESNHAPVVRIVKTPDPELDHYGTGDLPAVGSTEWFKAFCAQYQLLPYDESKDTDSSEDLRAQCDKALRDLTEAGLTWRYGDGVTDAHRQRLERELGILSAKDISAYFLIVWDFVNEARRRGISSNARGSGVGTMVGYVLGLSNACPVKFGLLFERFTDPDRSEYPDIDIDICQDGRQQIIEYVREKYGYVAQIITFGTMKARAAIRDVGRVLDMPLSEVDRISKLIGDELGMTLERALDREPDLKSLYDSEDKVRSVYDTARRLEGIARHSGVHAAGAVIATQPLDNIIPLAISKQGNREILVTQWDGPTCDRVGLLKMDFLGLRTLSIIEKARQFVTESLDDETIRRTIRPDGPWPEDWDPLDLERISFDDQSVFELYRRAETAGTFQFESDGMRNMLLAMKPDRLEDLIAGNALFRPGPMDLIDDYVARKHGQAEVPEVHPIVDSFTESTYGIMVYQEQVMQIVHELGGIPLREAYTLIKAISKKKAGTIDAARVQFIAGAGERGLTEQKANELFDLILKFAGYGFNKSHSAGYSIVAYQTAYLKTYFPVQYMAAVLTYESGDTDKVVKYIDECKRVRRPDGSRGIEVRPPDINLSNTGFSVVFETDEPHDANHGHIRFGLGAVKGVGDKAIAAIIEQREKDGPFTGLYDFCERVPLSSVNRATIVALIKCGAFDSLHGADRRAAMIEALDSAMQAGHRAKADRDSGQLSFFGSFSEAAPAAEDEGGAETPLPDVAPWSPGEQLQHEKAVLGFYVSSHPLDRYERMLESFATCSVADAMKLPEATEVILGVMLQRVRTTVQKKDQRKMAMLTVEDKSGRIDAVVFASNYPVYGPLLTQDAVLFLKGKVDRKREQPNILIDEAIPPEQAAEQLTRRVRIVLEADDSSGNGRLNGGLNNLKALLRQSSASGGGNGNDHTAEVVFEVHQQGMIATLGLNGTRVHVTADLPERIDSLISPRGHCELIGPPRLVPDDLDADATATEGSSGGRRLSRAGAGRDESCASIDRY